MSNGNTEEYDIRETLAADWLMANGFLSEEYQPLKQVRSVDIGTNVTTLDGDGTLENLSGLTDVTIRGTDMAINNGALSISNLATLTFTDMTKQSVQSMLTAEYGAVFGDAEYASVRVNCSDGSLNMSKTAGTVSFTEV